MDTNAKLGTHPEDVVAVLRISDARAAYGKKDILRGVSLSVARGEIVALIGPNGAGKSTLLRVVAGLLMPTRGSVALNGREITRLPPHERSRLGVGYAMQNGRIFPNLTVEEHLELATQGAHGGGAVQPLLRVTRLFPELKPQMKVRAGLLSGGFRQILAIAVAVVREPHLLLLDEPSAGLAPKVAESVFQGVRRWKEESESAVLIVEQNVRGAFSVANRVVVLAEGVNVLESTDPSTLLSSGILDTLFLGTSRYGTFAACKRREESNE